VTPDDAGDLGVGFGADIKQDVGMTNRGGG